MAHIHFEKKKRGTLTDLLTSPCGIPGGGAAATTDTGGGAATCGGGTVCGAWAPALCGASCGVVL